MENYIGLIKGILQPFRLYLKASKAQAELELEAQIKTEGLFQL